MNIKNHLKAVGISAVVSILSCKATFADVQHVYSLQKGMQVSQSSGNQYILHLGSFSQKSNAMRFKAQMSQYTDEQIKVKDSAPYSVYVGPLSGSKTRKVSRQLTQKEKVDSSYMSSNSASQPLEAIKDSLFPQPKVVVEGDSKMGTIHSYSMTGHKLSFLGSLGYAGYNGTYDGNGQTAVGRFATHIDLYDVPKFNLSRFGSPRYGMKLGFEIGVQSGNSFPIDTSEDNINDLGGLPISSTVLPMLDFLGTIKVSPLDQPTFAIAKGGFTLRRWHVDRSTIDNLYQVNGELQAGFGMNTTEHTSISLLYQGVWGGNPNLEVNAADATATVSNIPSQNGFLLTMALTV